MEKSSFFNSREGDRRYKAEDWASYFASFISNGVMPLPSSGLQVVAGENMTIQLREGKAWINGYFYNNTDYHNLTLDFADGVLNRIDRVVIRWDLTARSILAAIKKGVPSASPVAPALQRDADVYEIAVADVLVNKGATAITQSNITDQRLNGHLCGVSAGIIQQIDTTEFNAQLQAWFREYMDLSRKELQDLVDYFNSLRLQSDAEYKAFVEYLNAYKTQGETEFETWFETIKAILDENAAGNLLNLITALQDRVKLIENVLFNDITANPFLIAFDNLDGVITSGVWNEALQRIEC